MTTSSIMRVHPRDEKEFDCRRYIRPGDLLQVHTMKTGATGLYEVPQEAVVLQAFEKFVLVRYRFVTETVGRWNISKINGHPVGNHSGWFGGLKARVAEG